jgi:ubiquinone/menaquinone biosynthesis C-methylase UbiE
VEGPRFQYHYKRIANHIKTYLKGKRDTILVDIGCGTGRGSLFFTETCTNIIGLDISLSLLKIFKEKLSLKGLNNVDLILCDAENLPLRLKIADVITFFGALHHIPNKLKALDEANRLLKPGE